MVANARRRSRWDRKVPKLGLPVNMHRPLFQIPYYMPCYNLPSPALLRELASRRILEVGAGSGVWGLLIAAAGGDVVSTDPRPWPMGHSYDHRSTQADRPFVQRHRARRAMAASFRYDRLVRPYPATLEGPDSHISHSKCGPSEMRFKSTGREPRALRDKPTFHPVEVMTAASALVAYPGRDILLLSPDPRDEWWAIDFLDGLPTGQRIYYTDDDRRRGYVPKGFWVLDKFDCRTHQDSDVMLLERDDSPRPIRPSRRGRSW